jgi:hypothetical protein
MAQVMREDPAQAPAQGTQQQAALRRYRDTA